MTTTDLSPAEYDPEQIRLMGEMCIVVDSNDKALNPESKKTCHLMTEIEKGLLHRAFSVFIFNSEGKLLLQQRADEKITFPGYFTNTCCSHPLWVEDEMVEKDQLGAKRAAIRKLEHELGIPSNEVPLDQLQFLTRIHYLAPSNGLWGEHEIDYIFLYQGDVSLNINPNEVKSFKWISKQDLMDLFKEEGLPITPWFRLIVENFLYKWWDNLDNLSSFKEEQIIHRL